MTGDLKHTDPALAIALDRMAPPRLPSDFADRVAQAAANRAPPTAQPAPRRAARGPWTRGRSIIIGAAAFGLMSAAAAATGVFGPITRETPVIGTIVASVAPSLISKPKAKPTPKPKPVMAKAVAQPAEAPAAIPALTPREERARLVLQRMENRAERRAALGLPPRPANRQRLRKMLRNLPPEDRVPALEKIRDQRRAAKGLPPLDAAQREARRAKMEQRLQGLTPEARLERVNQRRTRRGLPPVGGTTTSTE